MRNKKIIAGSMALALTLSAVYMPENTMDVIPLLTADALSYGDLQYEQIDNYIKITDCDESVVSVDIPAQINGLSVKTIGDYAFDNCRNLTSVTIPDSITEIGNGAFYECEKLTDVKIPNGVTLIDGWAFSHCIGLTSITIPDSVTMIGTYAFSGCTGLKEISVSDNNKYYSSVQGVLFNKDKTVLIQYPAAGTQNKYTVPDSVTEIGKEAFGFCENLSDITIPHSVTYIGDGAFSYCTGLEGVSVSENNKYYCADQGVLFNKNKTTLVLYPAASAENKYTIPGSVTEIGNEAFCCCKNLTSVTIPQKVTRIGEWAFSNCTGLTGITLPDSLTIVRGWTFYNCTSLKSIKIPDNVTSIGDFAFEYCESLADVTIGNSLSSIGEWAFSDCKSLTSITIPKNVSKIENAAFYECTSLKSITIENPECEIYDNNYTIDSPAVIYGYKDSTAQTHAQKYGYTFKLIGEEPILRGDISGNGKIDLQDAIIIAKYLLGTKIFNDNEKNLADFNDDSKIDLYDVIGIAKYLLGNK